MAKKGQKATWENDNFQNAKKNKGSKSYRNESSWKWKVKNIFNI